MPKGGEHILRNTATLENPTVIQNSTRKCPQSENSLQSSMIDNAKVVESTIEAIPKFQDNSKKSTGMCLQSIPAIPNDSYKCIQPASLAIAGPGVTGKTPLMPKNSFATEQTTGKCLQLAPVEMECSEEIAENTQDCQQPIPETQKYSKMNTLSTELSPHTIIADLNDCGSSSGILPNSSDHKNDKDDSRDESPQCIPQVTENNVMIESTGKSLQCIPQVTENNIMIESTGKSLQCIPQVTENTIMLGSSVESLKEIQEAQGDSTPIETHSDKYNQPIPLVFQSPKVIEKQGRKHKPAVLHDFTVIKESSNKCNQPILTVLKTSQIMKTSFKQGPQSVRVVPKRSEDKSSEKCLKSSTAMFGPSKPDLLNFQVSCTRPNCHDSTGVLALPGVVMSYRNQTSTDTKVGITSSSEPYKQPVILIAYNKDNKNGIASRKTLNSKKFREKSDKEIQNKPKGNFPNNNLKKPCNVDDSDQGNSFKSSKALSVSDKKCLYCNETVSDMGIHVVLSHPLKAPYKPPLKKQKTKRDGSQLLSNQFSLCHVCGKGFDRRLHLWKHLQVHSTEKQFVCHVCGMSFRLEGTLRHHSLTHTEKRQFKCPVCNKTFNARRYLIKHVRTHVKEKLFECKGCSKRFTTQEYLNTHMRKHISGKLKKFSAFKLPASRKQNVQITHKCDVCDKVFEKRRYLTRHAKIHAEAKRFNCNICGKQFRTQEYVDSHALKMHNIKPKPRGSFSCKICQKKYSNPVWYERHRTSHDTNTEPTERISDSEAEPQE